MMDVEGIRDGILAFLESTPEAWDGEPKFETESLPYSILITIGKQRIMVMVQELMPPEEDINAG